MEDKYRWEFCPHCGDGWPDYLGPTKTHHQFSCTHPSCEGFFTVKKGIGNYDKREGMKIAEGIAYLFNCDGCNQLKAVKLKNYRFLCRKCFKKFNICKCPCNC